MQRTGANNNGISAGRKVQSSTTLNRKYVKKPTASKIASDSSTESVKIVMGSSARKAPAQVAQSASISRFAGEAGMAETIARTAAKDEEKIAMSQKLPVQNIVSKRMQQRQQMSMQNSNIAAKRLTAKELKDQAIRKALASAARDSEPQEDMAQKKKTKSKKTKMHFGAGRVLLALGCATVAVIAIAYFVNINMPDISLRVAAMQTGIEAKYPGYVPRDFSLSSITSENGKITLVFNNISTNTSFAIYEENSSWDSRALMSNYVSDNFGDDYTVLREQGLTLYVGKKETVWVNGGIFYKIKVDGENLTKKQIYSIATSLQ